VQLKIDALKEAAARPGARQRTTVASASQFMAAGLYQEGQPPAELDAGRRPGPTERKPNDHPESIPRRRGPGDLPAQVHP
jgi:hypothetical protein